MKGKQVYVEGRLQTRSYDDKDGKKVWATDVVADEVILLGGRGDSGPSGGGDEYSQQESMKSAPRGRQAPAAPAPAAPMSGGVDEDDVPF